MEFNGQSKPIPFIQAEIAQTTAAEFFDKTGAPIATGKETPRIVLDPKYSEFNIEIKLDNFFNLFGLISTDFDRRHFVPLNIKDTEGSIKRVSVHVNELALRLHSNRETIFEKSKRGELENFIKANLDFLKQQLKIQENVNLDLLKQQLKIQENLLTGDLETLPESLKKKDQLFEITKYFFSHLEERSLQKFGTRFYSFYQNRSLHIYQLNPYDFIGTGSQATVRKVFYMNVGKYAAFKEPNEASSSRFLIHEAQILKLLGPHPGIQKAYQIFYNGKNGTSSGLLSRLYEYGSMKEEKGLRRFQSLSDIEKIKMIKNIVGALALMEEKKVVHGDVKPDNFFMSENRIVFADFGIAHHYGSNENKPISYSYTPEWVVKNEVKNIKELIDQFNQHLGRFQEAIEQREHLRDQIFIGGSRLDVWATGASLYTFFTGTSHLKSEQYEQSERGRRLIPNPDINASFDKETLANSGCPVQIIHLIERMVDPNPETRITANEANKLINS